MSIRKGISGVCRFYKEFHDILLGLFSLCWMLLLTCGMRNWWEGFVVFGGSFLLVLAAAFVPRIGVCGMLGRIPVGWDLAQYLFSRKIREEIYEPAKEDLRQDWALGRPKFPSGLPRILFHCFMLLRTIVMVAECMRVAISRPLGKLVPPALKALWRMFS
jgi:hypothetical protein